MLPAATVHHAQHSTRLLRPLLLTLSLGALGALCNYLLLSPLPSPVFYLGGLFYLPVLLRFGTSYGLLCATLTQLPLLPTLYYWLPLPELLVLGWLLHRRRLSPMRAALYYWLTVGMASSIAIAMQPDSWSSSTRIIALATPPLTGLVLMGLTTHTMGLMRRRPAQQDRPIAAQLSDLLVLFACLPVLAFHVLGTPTYVRAELNKALRDLAHAEQVSQDRFQLLIERNLRGLATIAEIIGSDPNKSIPDYEVLINRIVGNLKDVFTILLIDQNGIALAGAPSHFPDGQSVRDAKQSYADRDYFIEAMDNLEPTVSYGIIGRRMNKEPLLSLVAPIVNEQHQFTGLVLGNLPVRRLQSVFLTIEQPEHFDGLIYDRKKQILYATEGLAAEPLAPLVEQAYVAHLSDELPLELELGSDLRPYLWQGRLFRHTAVGTAGGMVIAHDLRPEIDTLAINSLLTLLVMGGLIGAARKLSVFHGKRLLAPLLELHRFLQTTDPTRLHQMQPLQVDSGTREFTELIGSVNGMMIRVAKARLETDWAIVQKDQINQDLDRKIAERTAELAQKAAELELLSTTDALTGLYNRRHLSAELSNEWLRSKRTDGRFALLILDVDHFKQINDRHGHPVGDDVLRRIGQCLREKIRSIDLAARYGGEEFALLLPGIDASHALVVAERLRLAFAELEITGSEGVFHFTVSIGICDNLGPDLVNESTILQRADQALYYAKRNGRNRCILWQQNGATDVSPHHET